MFNVSYIISQNSITLVIDGNTHVIENTHKNWDLIKQAIKDKDQEAILKLIDLSSFIKLSDDLKIEGGFILYRGEPLHGVLVDRILQMQAEGFDIDPMIAFLENLLQNPSHSSVNELYLFLEKSNLPITADGHFLAYKRVKSDFKDFYSGKFDNSIGKIVEMPRWQVDDVRDNTCSKGLHFCSLSYLKHYHSGEGKIVIVKVNPKDVVSVPSDYDNAKGRCCRYEVVSEHVLDERTEAFNSSVYDEDSHDPTMDDYYDDDYNDYDDENNYGDYD